MLLDRANIYNNKLEAKKNLLSNKERLNLNKGTYKLSVINIPENVARKGINLTCVPKSCALHDMAKEFQWSEIIFKSLVTLDEKKNNISVKLQESFYKRIFRCQVIHGNDRKILFTKEFMLIETSKNLIVPFVTAEPSVDIRGGHLVVGNPAVFPVEGQNLFFISFNLANYSK